MTDAEVLTAGFAAYDEFEGLWGNITELRNHHPAVSLLVIDTGPRGCSRTRSLVAAKGGSYHHRPDLEGTAAPRSALFALAKSEFVLVMDAHLGVPPGSIQAALDYARANPASDDLVQGPMLHDDAYPGHPGGVSTHWRPTTRPGVWGTWSRAWRHATGGPAFDPLPEGEVTPGQPDRRRTVYHDLVTGERLIGAAGIPLPICTWPEHAAALRADGFAHADETHEPFPVPGMGLGQFMMRRAAWPGFHPLHRGFGAEEGYLHEKVRHRGGQALCLPGMPWQHRFRWMEHGAPPPPYPLKTEDHVWNLLVTHRELGIEAEGAILRDFGKNVPSLWDRLKAMARESQPFGQPLPAPPRLKLLGVWYSNNAAPAQLMADSLATTKAAADSTTRHEARVTTCSWNPVGGNPFPWVKAARTAKPGHATIVEQVRQCLDLAGDYEYDAVVFLEHDVLYPADYFDRVGDAFARHPDAPVVSNLDYEGLNATGWLGVRQRDEPMHQLSMRAAVARANIDRAARDCERQGWGHLEPDSDPVVTRTTPAGLLGADFDHTITAGWVPPAADYVVITGRFPHERQVVRDKVGHDRIYCRTPEASTDELIGLFKARTIKELGVVEFWDDNPIHVAAIRRECPGVVVNHVSGNPPKPDRSAWVRIPPRAADDKVQMPAVHVNHGSRFTSHGEVVYHPHSGGKVVHPYWGKAERYWRADYAPAPQPVPAHHAAPASCVPCGAGKAAEQPVPFADAAGWLQAVSTPHAAPDCHEHLAAVKELAEKCEHVTELNAWGSPWLAPILAAAPKAVVSVGTSEMRNWKVAQHVRGSTVFVPRVGDPAAVDLAETDMLLTDTRHTADQLYAELSRHAPKVRKYVVIHDSEIYGEKGDDGGPGLLAGLRRWLKEGASAEWVVKSHAKNNYGLTVLSRLPEDRKEEPGILRKAANFARATAKHVAGGSRKVTEKVAGERLDLCMTCEHRTFDSCSACGCPVASKTQWATEDCGLVKLGLPPKWAATTREEDLEPR